MFDYFKDRREQLALMAAFKEAAAISSWVLITTLELNEQFFRDNTDEFDKANVYLQRGLSYSEQGNHRAANNHFMTFVNKTLQQRPELITAHPSIVEAVVRIRKLASEIIDPLWEKHQDKLP